MIIVARVMLVIALFLSFTTPCRSAQSAASSQETLMRYTEQLKKNPADNALREKIITLALTMKPAPTLPEKVERNMARGSAFAQKAADAGGYIKALVEFQEAVNSAPWLALAYYNLGVVQEKVGFYAESIQNLKFYLMAAPDAANGREVRNKIYALEADVEDLKTGKYEDTSETQTAGSASDKKPEVTGKTTLVIEPVKPLDIISLPPAEKKMPAVPAGKKSRFPGFVGNWFYKDSVRGEERTVQAFEISTNANGDIVANAPKRIPDYIPAIRDFQIADAKIKIIIHWRMKSVVGYWKIETYELTLSEDGEKLTGSYVEKSVGGRIIELNRTLFRLDKKGP